MSDNTYGLASLQRWRDLVADRPLVMIDLETTSTDTTTAAIVEFGAACYDGPTIEAAIAASDPGECLITLPVPAWTHVQRVNPGVPIPPGATRAHHITDADVAECPNIDVLREAFTGLAAEFRLGGYNVIRYDLPILSRIFGVTPAVAPIDVMGLTAITRDAPRPTGKVPWTCGGPISMLGPVFGGRLSDQYAGYRGAEMVGKHGAVADATATAEILFAALLVWPELPATADDLAELCARALMMVQYTPEGWLFIHGKHKNLLVTEVERIDPTYLGWLLCAEDMDELVKITVTEIIGAGRAAQLREQQEKKRKRSKAA